MEITVNTVEEGVFLAKVAEQAERYEDMIKYMKDIVSVQIPLKLNRLETS